LFRALAPVGFGLTPQVGNGLGERLDNVLRLYLQSGYTQAVVIDSDSPTLPAAYLAQAFQELDDPAVDAVFGPCEDGGYYLVGLKAPCAALFRGLVMSTPTVLAETLKRARAQRLRVACLATWYDVDTLQDLARLCQDLAHLPPTVAPIRDAWPGNSLGSAPSISRTTLFFDRPVSLHIVRTLAQDRAPGLRRVGPRWGIHGRAQGVVLFDSTDSFGGCQFMIQVENLTKSYGDVLALDHASFQVAEGEILAF